MTLVLFGAYLLLQLFIVIMWIRAVLGFVMQMNRDFRPSGAGLVIAEFVFTVTDPPIKAVRKVVPPLRIGGIAIDLAFSIVVVVAILLGFALLRLA